MTDILESEDFENLMVALAYCPLEIEPLHKSNIKAFIRQHFTTKTVEDAIYYLTTSPRTNELCIVDFEPQGIHFVGTREECEAEKQRVESKGIPPMQEVLTAAAKHIKEDIKGFESLTKVREESIQHWRKNAEEDYITTPISVLRYISQLEKREPVHNRDNYREELFKASLAAYQGLLSSADRHSQEGDCQSWNYQHLSEISIIAGKSFISAINKEVKSNPASE